MTLRRTAPARALAAALAIGMGALGLAGCSSGDADPTASAAAPAPASARVPLGDLTVLADPASYVGPSTAVIADASIDPVMESPAQQLPAEVTSHPRSGDATVTVTDTSRIVAMDLSGSIAAMVWGLGFGDSLVGRDEAAGFPGIEDLPVVTGSSHTVTPEAVLALEPTLVLTDGSIGPSDAVRQIEDAGITVVYVTNEPTYDGAGELARQVAAVLGAPAAGDALASRIADEVATTRSDIAAIIPPGSEPLRIVFLYLRGDSGIYYMFGKESGADEVIEALGGVDAADDAGITGMRPLTDEAMLAADPDVVLVMTGGLESVGGVDALLASRPAIALTSAGQRQRVVDMDDRQILAFGPRSAAVLDALARAIYAPDAG